MLGNDFDTFKITILRTFFFSGKCFIPGGSLLADSQRGPIVFTYVLFGVGRGGGGFKSSNIGGLFEILKMCYPPEGVCSQTPKGVQLFLLMFYFGLGNDP